MSYYPIGTAAVVPLSDIQFWFYIDLRRSFSQQLLALLVSGCRSEAPRRLPHSQIRWLSHFPVIRLSPALTPLTLCFSSPTPTNARNCANTHASNLLCSIYTIKCIMGGQSLHSWPDRRTTFEKCPLEYLIRAMKRPKEMTKNRHHKIGILLYYNNYNFVRFCWILTATYSLIFINKTKKFALILKVLEFNTHCIVTMHERSKFV